MLNRMVSCQNMTTAQIGEELQRVAAAISVARFWTPLG